MLPYFDANMVLYYSRRPIGSWLNKIRYAFDESKHLRGQPDNAGQFVDKTGIMNKNTAESFDQNESKNQYLSGPRENPGLPQESRPQLSDREIAEVEQYLDEQTPYYDVNEHLRSGGQLYGDSKVLQGAIEKSGKFSEPVTVSRGIEVDDIESLIEELKTGSFTDRGFMSASTSRSFSGNVQFTIKANHGLDASFYGSNSGELLLPANSDFKVISLDVKGSKVEVVLEQI